MDVLQRKALSYSMSGDTRAGIEVANQMKILAPTDYLGYRIAFNVLLQGGGWVNANTPTTVISGDGEFAVIENNGKNTYKRLPIEEEISGNALTYPTNIKVEYSDKYHQVRFTWDKMEGADRYGIAVYLSGKWRVQTQNITGTTYTSPKNLTPGRSYRVAIAARVNGRWDTTNAIRHSGTVTIK